MAPKVKKSIKRTIKNKKPKLIQVGKHFINPLDVSCISEVSTRREEYDEDVQGEITVKKTLYVVRFVSNPNPAYPCWVNREDISILLEQFEIIAM